jgi:hypothetical protein
MAPRPKVCLEDSLEWPVVGAVLGSELRKRNELPLVPDPDEAPSEIAMSANGSSEKTAEHTAYTVSFCYA